MKKNQRKKLICIIIIIIGLSLILLVNILLLKNEIDQYSESSRAYNELRKFVYENDDEYNNENTTLEDNTINNTNILIDFESLKKEEPNVIGWILQENTNINYPIMQTDNNEYYSNHLYDGTKNKSGSIYLDYENKSDFKDYNSVIYGHNLNDGNMFSSLLKYSNQDYYNANKTINLILPDNNTYELEIFSAFVASPNENESKTSPWNIKWENFEDYSIWLENMSKRSIVKTDTSISPGDKIVTFSTCTADGKNRFIVMAKIKYN